MLKLMAGLIAATAFWAAPAQAQDYPAKPIHLVVPGAAGGGADIMARTLASFMQNALKQTVIVDNKPGAQQLLGTVFVAKAPADGYTLLVSPSISAFPVFIREPGVDVARDLEFVSLLMQAPQIVAVHGASPVKSIADLAAISKADPNKLNFASYGQLLWVQTEIFNRAAGIKATHIPFSNAPEGARTVATGAADYIIGSMTPMRPYLANKQIRLLAVTSNKRDPNIPDVPSLQEAGVKMDDLTVWIGVLAPRATPRPIIDRLSAVVAQAVKDPKAAQQIRTFGFEPTSSTPEEFRAMFVKEQDAMIAAGKELGIKPE